MLPIEQISPVQEESLDPSILPRLVEFVGQIASVCFDKPKIIIRDVNGEEHICQATRELIDRAIDLRHERVAGKMLIRPDMKRLLILRDASQPESIPNQTERDRHLFEKWDGTLRNSQSEIVDRHLAHAHPLPLVRYRHVFLA